MKARGCDFKNLQVKIVKLIVNEARNVHLLLQLPDKFCIFVPDGILSRNVATSFPPSPRGLVDKVWEGGDIQRLLAGL